VIDDFRSTKTPHLKTMPSLRPQRPIVDVKKPSSMTTRAIRLASAHKPQPSKTLMRAGVSKPKPSPIKLAHRVQTHAGVLPAKSTPYAQHAPIEQSHLLQAFSVHKSHAISRFGLRKSTHLTTRTTPLPVQSSPATGSHALPTAAAISEAFSATHQAKSHRSNASVAAAHHQAQHHNKHRLLETVAGCLAIVLVLGFIIYINIPNIEVKIASYQAGISAVIPSYRPPDFKFSGPVHYSQGVVYVTFRSELTNQTITIAQQKSNWDSQTLLDNDSSVLGNNFQTLNVQGRVVYIYGAGSALWVDNNVLYQITGTANLSTDQLTAIAAST
jgi:hypothetical protein